MTPAVTTIPPRPAAGAWKIPPWYGLGMRVPSVQWPRVRLVTKAILRRLIDLEYLDADPAKLDGGWGVHADHAARQFQHAQGLVVDGKVGPKSAHDLWLPLYQWIQNALGITGNLLYGQGNLESAGDPGAEGANPRGPDWFDRGLHQINKHAHADIPDAQAYDPGFAINWSGRNLRAAYDHFGDWRYAVGAHNDPDEAQRWADGRPPRETDPVTGETSRDKLVRYVALVFENAKR